LTLTTYPSTLTHHNLQTDCGFELPDGTRVKMDEEGLAVSVMGGEVFFEEFDLNSVKEYSDSNAMETDNDLDSNIHPGVMNGQTLPALIHSALTACDPTLRKTLCQNIILTGGSSRIPGLVQRLQKEVRAMACFGLSLNNNLAPKRCVWPN